MQEGMLKPDHFNQVADALKRGASRAEFNRIVSRIRMALNPHPAGQKSANVPRLDDEPVQGLQHKRNNFV